MSARVIELSEENQLFYYRFAKKLFKLSNYLITQKSNVFTKKLINEILDKKSLILDDPNLYNVLVDLTIQHLVENIVVRNSKVFKFILSKVFDINIIPPESRFLNFIFPSKDLPKIFSKKTYNIPNSLEELLNENIELKEEGDLFLFYKPVYPFNKDKIKEILILNRINRGKLYLLENLCFLFPEYLEMNYSTFGTLMCEEGYLPISWRYFLAIMVFIYLIQAVSTIKSQYLLTILEDLFLINGGNKEWLIHGLKKVPEKLSGLSKYNNIMAHQPWKLQTTTIKELFEKHNLNWSFSEFVQASLILFYFHKLASITESLGISVRHSFSYKSLKKDSEFTDIMNDGYSTSEETETEFQTFLKKRDKKDTKCFDKYISDYCTVYLDFDVHSDISMSYVDFNWYDNGFDILSDFLPKGVKKLDEEIRYINNLKSINDQNKLNDMNLRRSIDCYTEKIFGYEHNDYDYSKVNRHLNLNHKEFIKNIATNPHNLNPGDITIIKVTYLIEEIFHIVLLTLNLKNRVQMTYLASKLYEVWKTIDL